MPELRRTLDWILEADFQIKIIVAGNHDITLDHAFYAQNHAKFHNQKPESSDKCIDLFAKNPSIVCLNHEARKVRLTKSDGSKTTFKVFGSPYSPVNGPDKWAFRYQNASDEEKKLWGQIPCDTDIVVTHTPRDHCDSSIEGNIGCEILRKALWNVRPRMVVCGHVHQARGYDRVVWDLADLAGNGELLSEPGELPPQGSKRQALIDLTGKKQRRLANDDSTDGNSQLNPDNIGPETPSDSTDTVHVVKAPWGVGGQLQGAKHGQEHKTSALA